MKQNILVLGSGGREHAIIKKLKQSKKVASIYAHPGNFGIFEDAKRAGGVDLKDFSSVKTFCQQNAINYVVVGSEQFLVEGIVDYLEGFDIKVFGPKRAGALIEGSKQFMKNLAKKYNIPTAKFGNFEKERDALNYIKTMSLPIVIKADGLAGGKGVVISQSFEDAESEIKQFFSGKFGDAGKKLVIEEFLDGVEASFFALFNSKKPIFLLAAEDYKRALDNNEGLNTGGMGSFAPSVIITDALKKQIMHEIIIPLFEGFKKENIEYKGVIFAGIMLVKNKPYLLEINARFGDPETQVILPLIENDFFNLIEFVCDDKEIAIKTTPNKAMCLVLTSKGYPQKFETGTVIKGLENIKNITVLHAATSKNENNEIIATGGRVLNLVAVLPSYKQARKAIYENAKKVDWKNGFYRKDIGARVEDE